MNTCLHFVFKIYADSGGKRVYNIITVNRTGRRRNDNNTVRCSHSRGSRKSEAAES